MKKIVIALIFLASFKITAQTTAVIATVVDSDGTTWINGTWSLSFAPNNNFPNPNQYKINSVPLVINTLNQKGTLSGAGALSFSTYDSSLITPAGSGWNLTICPQASAKCGVLLFSTSGASNDISSSITAAIPAPRFNATPGAYGYADIEAVLTIPRGGTYYSTSSLCPRYFNGTSWACTGSGGGVNPGTTYQIATYPTNGTSIGGSLGTVDNVGNLTAPGNIASPNIPINVLAFNTLAHPVDITGIVDSTVGIQAAISAMNPTQASLYFPSGTYKISSTLLIQNAYRQRVYGNGNSSVIAPTLAMAGLPVFKFSAVYQPSLRDMWIEGNASGQPKAAVEFYVPTGYTVSSQQADLENLRIGSDGSSNTIQYGVIWDHQAGAAANANNDQAFIKDVTITNFSAAAYQISGSNSLWHHFVGGHIINGPIAWDIIGGSIKTDGMSVSNLSDTVFNFEDPLSGEIYEYGSSVSELTIEGAPELIRTTAAAYPYTMAFKNIKGKVGSDIGVNTLIDYKFKDGTFTLDGDELATAFGVNFNFADTNNQVVNIENLTSNVIAINYGSTLQMSGNHWSSGAGPTLTSTNIVGQGALSEIGDRIGNSPQFLPAHFSNIQIDGFAAALTINQDVTFARAVTLTSGARTGIVNNGDYHILNDGDGLQAPDWRWYQVGGVAYLRDTTDSATAWYCQKDAAAPPCTFTGLINLTAGVNFVDPTSLLKSNGNPGTLGQVFTSQGSGAPPVWTNRGNTGGTLSISSGTQAANSCSTNATVTITGLTTSGPSSRPLWSYVSDPGALVGWGSTGGMKFQVWETGVDTGTWHVCNDTASPITYSAINLSLGAN